MKIVRYLLDAELEKLLLYIREKADLARRRGTTRAVIDEAIVLLLLNTGLRPSELCNLNIADSITEHGRKVIMVRDASGNVPRAINVTGDIAEYLLRFVRLYRKNAEPVAPLLVSERGTRFGYMSLYNKLKRIGKSAKVGNLHPRVLRATYLVRLYNSKQDLWFVQQQAGHASPRTTAIYATAGSDSHLLDVPPDRADSEMIEKAHLSSRQPVIRKQSPEREAKHRETVSVKRTQQIETCEACGRPIGDRSGTKIDSGQVLCASCIEELRKR
jgi:integrase